MARMAFQVRSSSGLSDLFIGFSWDEGGIHKTAVFAVSSFSTSVLAHITSSPVEIPGGFPGLSGKRIFLDVMGTSLVSSYLDVDFKIYRPSGTQPIYQTPTLSVNVLGTCLNNFTINTTVTRGGIVAERPQRQFIAGMLGLLDPSQIPAAPSDPAHDERMRQCFESSGRSRAFGPGGSIGAYLRCINE